MNRSYTILFPSTKKNLYRWMGRFILLGSSMLYIGLSDPSHLKYGWPALGLLLLVLDILWTPLLSEGLTIQVCGWIAAGQWLMAGILLLLYLFHRQSIKEHSLRIDSNGIRISFPWKRRFAWNAIEFMILKDGLLTIEYKNGRVLQQPIQKDPALNEAEFNEFCNQQCTP